MAVGLLEAPAAGPSKSVVTSSTTSVGIWSCLGAVLKVLSVWFCSVVVCWLSVCGGVDISGTDCDRVLSVVSCVYSTDLPGV